MGESLTLSAIKADIGGWVGHSSVRPEVAAVAERRLMEAKRSGVVLDGCRGRVGNDTSLIMTHRRGRHGAGEAGGALRRHSAGLLRRP